MSHNNEMEGKGEAIWTHVVVVGAVLEERSRRSSMVLLPLHQ